MRACVCMCEGAVRARVYGERERERGQKMRNEQKEKKKKMEKKMNRNKETKGRDEGGAPRRRVCDPDMSSPPPEKVGAAADGEPAWATPDPTHRQDSARWEGWIPSLPSLFIPSHHRAERLAWALARLAERRAWAQSPGPGLGAPGHRVSSPGVSGLKTQGTGNS